MNLKNKLVEGITSMKKPADELTLEGIKKHQVISFGDGQSKIDTLKELLRGSRKMTIVVFVDSYLTVPTLVREMQDLSHDGWKVLPINGYKSKKLKDKIMQELSQSDLLSRVFITTEGLSRSARWFDFDQVRLVVNYDLAYHPVHFLNRMGRFKEADAIYFVTGVDWPMLVDTQTKYNVDFEVGPRQWPTGFCLREEQQIATNLNKEFPSAQDIRHFVYQAQDSNLEWKLTGFLDDVMEQITPRKSVVFVNALKEVNFLLEEVRGTYGKLIHSGEFQVFTDYSKFRVCEGCCMLITHDEAILDIDPPKNVPWVINYDPPSTMVLYDRRSAWCKGRGVVVHLVVSHDWLKVFYIPIRYKSFLSMLPGKVPD